MRCELAKEQFADWLAGKLPTAEQLLLDEHIADCPTCQQELAETRQLWQRLAVVPTPEPGSAMRTQFYAMLDTFEAAEQKTPQRSWSAFLSWIRQGWTPEWSLRLAYGLVLLGIGVGMGYWLSERRSPEVAYQQRIDTLSAQVQDMRQMMMLSLLENPSATERLRAVSYTDEIKGADEKVVTALLTTLNNDPNVNVRLVTLEALAKLAADSNVREGLVQSIARQDSPLVQSALADVMVKLQEKRSIKPLRQLLNDTDLNHLVKAKIQQTIKQLS